jgi:hypothetical protein
MTMQWPRWTRRGFLGAGALDEAELSRFVAVSHVNAA